MTLFPADPPKPPKQRWSTLQPFDEDEALEIEAIKTLAQAGMIHSNDLSKWRRVIELPLSLSARLALWRARYKTRFDL